MPQSMGSGPSPAISGEGIIDWHTLKVSLEASSKLFYICAFVVYLVKTKLLPETIPSILSQVAFRIIIPCFLMAKVALTLGLNPEPDITLMALPLMALLQIMAGGLLGKIVWELCRSLECIFQSSRCLVALLQDLWLLRFKRQHNSCSNFTSSDSFLNRGHAEVGGSYSPLPKVGDTKAAEACITSYTLSRRDSRSSRDKERSNERMKQEAPQTDDGFQSWSEKQKEAVVVAACALGNSTTLPMLLITGTRGPAATEITSGFMALYQLGWFPAVWTVGYHIITGMKHQNHDPRAAVERPGNKSIKETLLHACQQLQEAISKILNPPMYGILVGLCIGVTPISRLALPVASTHLSTHPLSAQQEIASNIFRPLFEAANTLGSGFLSVQLVVLAASLASAMPGDWVALKASWYAKFKDLLARCSPRRPRWLVYQRQPYWERLQIADNSSPEHAKPETRVSTLCQGLQDSGSEDTARNRILQGPGSLSSALEASTDINDRVERVTLPTDQGEQSVDSKLKAVQEEPAKEVCPQVVLEERRTSEARSSVLPARTSSLLRQRSVAAKSRRPSAADEAIIPAANVRAEATSISIRKSTGGEESCITGAGCDLKMQPSYATSEGRALLIICLVRLLLFPGLGSMAIMEQLGKRTSTRSISCFLFILHKALAKHGLIPSSPISTLLLLTEMCMPTAQNLIIIAQLNEETRPVARFLSSLLLKQYAISIIPMTVWISIFLGLVHL